MRACQKLYNVLSGAGWIETEGQRDARKGAAGLPARLLAGAEDTKALRHTGDTLEQRRGRAGLLAAADDRTDFEIELDLQVYRLHLAD